MNDFKWPNTEGLKIKKGFFICYEYIKHQDGSIKDVVVKSIHNINKILKRNDGKDHFDDKILNIIWVSPKYHEVSLEEATEQIKEDIKVGTFWKHKECTIVCKVIFDSVEENFSFNEELLGKGRYGVYRSDNDFFRYSKDYLYKFFVQVKNWKGETI